MKKLIRKILLVASIIMMLLMSGFMLVKKYLDRKTQFEKSSENFFYQIESIMDSNSEEFDVAISEIKENCMTKAQAASYILSNLTSKITPLKLREIAAIIDVDEIHLFNSEGVLYLGSQEKYIGFSFDSGEQMAFFKPLLENKDLFLCQEIMPNTAEGKNMQYSALWSENRKFIVQIGYEPHRISEMTERNELPYIFSLLTDSLESNIIAIDPKTFKVKGSARTDLVGKSIEYLGMKRSFFKGKDNNFTFVSKQGDKFFSVHKKSGDIILCRIIPYSELFDDFFDDIFCFILHIIISFIVFYFLLAKVFDRYIVNSINRVNCGLKKIGEGNLEEKIRVDSIPEFMELSEYINNMVGQLKKDLTEDILTGLASRRAFYSEINKYFYAGECPAAAFYMIDADSLKYVNDTYGHEIGDMYLMKIATILKSIPASNRIIARLGGDEFVVVVYGETRAEFNRYFESYKELRSSSKIIISMSEELNVSFSIGMSIANEDGTNYHDLLKVADKRMYQDKISRKKSRKL